MTDEEIATLERKLKAKTEENEHLLQRVRLLVRSAEKELIAKPRGLFRKKCPYCKKILSKYCISLGGRYHYYKCQCGYEYAYSVDFI